MVMNRARGSQKYPPKGMPKPQERSYPWGWISIRLSMNIIVSDFGQAKETKAGINTQRTDDDVKKCTGGQAKKT